MSTSNLDSANLKAVAYGGLINEDVMQKIFDISAIPLPFTDLIGTSKSKQERRDWVTEELAAPNPANFVVDGADASGNDTVTGDRVNNHHQESVKVVRVSDRANNSDVIGGQKELAKQISRRQQELKRDVEAILLLNQASLQDDGNTVAGKVGGLPTWLKSNTANLTTPVGFNSATGLTTVPTATADGIALSETDVRAVIQSIYENGGDPSVMMSTPAVISKFSEYLFTSSARVASMMSDQGKSSTAATALGAINVFVSDFGTVKLVSNRLQMKYGAAYATPSLTAANADVFIFDPSYLEVSYLQNVMTKDLARTGLAANKQMSVDYTLVVKTEKAAGVIASVNGALAAVG